MPEDFNTASADPARMAAATRGVIPSLSMGGSASEASEFYARAFGAHELARMPDESDPATLLHVMLEINGGGLMMSDCQRPGAVAKRPEGVVLQLVTADGDLWWNRAVEAGCKVVIPFETMFWGDRWGLLEDPFGVEWALDEPAGG